MKFVDDAPPIAASYLGGEKHDCIGGVKLQCPLPHYSWLGWPIWSNMSCGSAAMENLLDDCCTLYWLLAWSSDGWQGARLHWCYEDMLSSVSSCSAASWWPVWSNMSCDCNTSEGLLDDGCACGRWLLAWSSDMQRGLCWHCEAILSSTLLQLIASGLPVWLEHELWFYYQRKLTQW